MPIGRAKNLDNGVVKMGEIIGWSKDLLDVEC